MIPKLILMIWTGWNLIQRIVRRENDMFDNVGFDDLQYGGKILPYLRIIGA